MEDRSFRSLAALRAFVAAARLGSFAHAAASLGLTAPAISHQTRKLERELGQRLFDRNQTGAVLTAAGRRLHPLVERGFRELSRGVAEMKVPVVPDHVTRPILGLTSRSVR